MLVKILLFEAAFHGFQSNKAIKCILSSANIGSTGCWGFYLAQSSVDSSQHHYRHWGDMTTAHSPTTTSSTILEVQVGIFNSWNLEPPYTSTSRNLDCFVGESMPWQIRQVQRLSGCYNACFCVWIDNTHVLSSPLFRCVANFSLTVSPFLQTTRCQHVKQAQSQGRDLKLHTLLLNNFLIQAKINCKFTIST